MNELKLSKSYPHFSPHNPNIKMKTHGTVTKLVINLS